MLGGSADAESATAVWGDSWPTGPAWMNLSGGVSEDDEPRLTARVLRRRARTGAGRSTSGRWAAEPPCTTSSRGSAPYQVVELPLDPQLYVHADDPPGCICWRRFSPPLQGAVGMSGRTAGRLGQSGCSTQTVAGTAPRDAGGIPRSPNQDRQGHARHRRGSPPTCSSVWSRWMRLRPTVRGT
jgi:hypothetical protein